MLHKRIQWKPRSQTFMVAKKYFYENETIECKHLIEANTLSDNISLNLLKILMPWLPFSNLWLLTMGSQGEAKSETKRLNGS